MNLFFTIFTAILSSIIGYLVIKQNSRKDINLTFAIFCISLASWAIANYFSVTAQNISDIIFWMRAVMAIAIVQSISFFLFIHTFPNSKIHLRKRFLIPLLLAGAVSCVVAFSPLLFSDVIFDEQGGRSPVVQPGMLLFIVVAVGSLLSAFIILIKKTRRSVGITRVQLRFILAGTLVMFFFILLFNLVLVVLFKISLFVNAAPFFILPFIIAVFYAITRHRLMDIRLLILRTITYSIVVLLISVAVVGFTLLLPEILGVTLAIKSFISIIVSIFIVLILGPLKRGIADATDKLFFKARIDYRQLLQELGQIINREIDMDVLLYALAHKMENSLKIKNISVYLSGIAGGGYYKRKGRLDKGGKKKNVTAEENSNDNNLEERISHNNPLLSFLRQRQEIIVLEALERKIEDTQNEIERKKLERSKAAMDKLDAALVAPVMVGNNLNAVLVLGPKLSGDPFGSEDINLMTLIGPQLASALEKSRLYEEARQFTERLKKEVAVATEDLRSINQQLQEQNRFLSALQKVTTLIVRTLDFEKVTQSVVDSIASEFGYLGGVLLLLSDDRHKLFPEAVTNTRITKKALKLLAKPLNEYYGSFPTDKSLSVEAIKTGKVKIGDKMSDFISPAVPQLVAQSMQKIAGIKTVVGVPVYSEDEIVGVINFMLREDQGQLKSTDLEAMKALAGQTGIVYRNIRLYKQLEESNQDLAEANKHLQQLDRAKSEFVSITSHQLRTPMTGIMGYLSMVLQGDFGKVPDEQNKVLQGLLEESQRMIRLINLFLNVSKIESGKMELNRSPIKLEDLVAKEITVLQKAAEDKGLKLVYKKPKAKLPAVMADADKLGDVIMNLTDNAIKYTDKGSVTLETKAGKDMAHFTVRDTGRGIKPEEAKKLFTKFVRGYGIAQVNPDGSGLGLYVARRLTEAHGGKIWVESDGEGKGSTFHVTIPLATEEDRKQTEKEENKEK